MNCLSLFEFVVNLGGNMKVFVEFVGSVFFVDLKLSQNPYMPTTHVDIKMQNFENVSGLTVKCEPLNMS